MIWAIFSDIHGNEQALDRFIKETESIVQGYLCLGDVVGYGPNSNECVKKVLNLPNLRIVSGNHEELFIDGSNLYLELPLVRTFHKISSANFEYLPAISAFPKSLDFYNYHCSHTISDLRIYKDTEISISKNYIIGHTHQQYEKQIGNYKIINPGSVGQNRQWVNLVDFAIYDSNKDLFEFKSVAYNFEEFVDKIIEHGYTKECIEYYLNKKRY